MWILVPYPNITEYCCLFFINCGFISSPRTLTSIIAAFPSTVNLSLFSKICGVLVLLFHPLRILIHFPKTIQYCCLFYYIHCFHFSEVYGVLLLLLQSTVNNKPLTANCFDYCWFFLTAAIINPFQRRLSNHVASFHPLQMLVPLSDHYRVLLPFFMLSES